MILKLGQWKPSNILTNRDFSETGSKTDFHFLLKQQIQNEFVMRNLFWEEAEEIRQGDPNLTQ